MSDILLHCQNLTIELNRKPIIERLHLTVKRGETVCVIGPSGCGKTTLLRAIAGMVPAKEGAIVLDGEEITNKKPEQRPVVMMFQRSLLFPHMTVLENVEYGLKLQKIAKNIRTETSKSILNQIGMDDYIHFFPHQLSGGQQQRVAFARALVTKPKLILFDEPFSSLDQKLRTSLRTWVKTILREEEITALFVTHDKEEAMVVGDQVAVMTDGTIRQIGQPFDVYQHPEDIDVATYFSEGIIINHEVFISNKNLQMSKTVQPVDGGVTLEGTVSGKWLRSGQLFYQVDIPSISQEVIVPGDDDGVNVADSVYISSLPNKQMQLKKHK